MNLLNEQIRQDVPVVCEEMSLARAKTGGTIGLFEDRYEEQVKVYTIGSFSKIFVVDRMLIVLAAEVIFAF
ncbi:MAG: hypothetical protein WCJ56_03460 [bacterium]